MKTFITGATGFIGASIVRELLKDGREVRVLVRKGSDTTNLAGLDVEVWQGDLRDGERLRHGLRGCDVLYHAAADYRLWTRDPAEMYRSTLMVRPPSWRPPWNIPSRGSSTPAASVRSATRATVLREVKMLRSASPTWSDTTKKASSWRSGWRKNLLRAVCRWSSSTRPHRSVLSTSSRPRPARSSSIS